MVQNSFISVISQEENRTSTEFPVLSFTKALVLAHRDMDRQKRNLHRMWFARTNAVIHIRGVFYSYSRLISDLYKKQLLLNRKIVAQIAISNRNYVYMISNDIRIEVDWKESTGII